MQTVFADGTFIAEALDAAKGFALSSDYETGWRIYFDLGNSLVHLLNGLFDLRNSDFDLCAHHGLNCFLNFAHCKFHDQTDGDPILILPLEVIEESPSFFLIHLL